MTSPSSEEVERTADPATRRAPRLARLFLLCSVLAAALAVMATGAREPVAFAPPTQVVQAAIPDRCAPSLELRSRAGGLVVLPPGHPPIPGFQPGGAVLELPPGHPPIDARHRGLPVPARPLEPLFEGPGTVDL